MSTLRVTLNTGETHDVEIVPETVVSFSTTTRDGRLREQTDAHAWCDVASVAPPPAARKPKPESV